MDPSKFSVRVKNPTMMRQERFSDASYADAVNDARTRQAFRNICYDKYETNFASWCAPRKVQTIVDSATSSGNDEDIDEELKPRKSIKNLRNVRRDRVFHQSKRLEELARPKLVASRVRRLQENHSRLHAGRQKKPEGQACSQTDLVALEPRIITERPVLRRRRPADRIAQLAEPKSREPIAANPLGKVNERALFAVASKRIAELATPRYGPSRLPPTDRSNPYVVNPQALRATCSPTIELLARPKKLPFARTSTKTKRP